MRQRLWEHLDDVSATIHLNRKPWMMVDDFNVIASITEKQGGQTDLGAIHEFQNCIARNGLIDAGYQGENFTWCNNRRGRARIWERPDRALINLQFQEKCEALTVQHLTRVTSDHSPLLIKIDSDAPRISSGIIFQRMWTEHSDFLRTVQDSWSQPVHGSPMLIFHRKLSRLRRRLKNWNWEVFGNVSMKRKELITHIQMLENIPQLGWDDSIHAEWESARKNLREVESWE